MTTYKVRLLAHGKPGEIREVDIPDGDFYVVEVTLDSIFYWGQNDFQPKQHPSVSVGDVIELEEKFYLVKAIGFEELSKEQLDKYNSLEQYNRMFQAYGWSD